MHLLFNSHEKLSVHGHEPFKINIIFLFNDQMQFNQSYNNVRERYNFLKGYVKDCTVSLACSYIQVR